MFAAAGQLVAEAVSGPEIVADPDVPIVGSVTADFLNLDLTSVTSVAGIGGLTSLEFVDLSENPSLTTGVEELANLPDLIDVDLLGSTAIPAAAITAIETAFTGVSGFTMTRPDGSTFSQ